MELKQRIDGIKYLQGQLNEIMRNLYYIYPNGHFDKAKAHSALQLIRGITESSLTFINSISEDK